MVSGHHSHAPRYERFSLDNYHTNVKLPPTKHLGIQPILSSDSVNVQSLENVLRKSPMTISWETYSRTRLTENLCYTPFQAHADGR